MSEQDPFFGEPWNDVDEWRDVPRPHRYVHGGFADTDTRFSFYFPPAELYEGRFFQFLEGGHGGSENALMQGMRGIELGHRAFDLAFEELGGYLLETNQGHIGNDLSGLKGQWSVTWYRASAEAARYAKELAAEMYGAAPHHGYVYGGSGGGMRSWSCMERAGDVYDGAVPSVISTIGGFTLSAHAYALEALGRDALAAVIDATEVGGSGNPFEGLTTQQREALAVLYRTGWARRGETQLRREYIFGFGMQGIGRTDPAYFDDFWNVKGYAGADGSADVAARLVEGKAVVRRVLKAADIDDPMAAYFARSPDAALAVELDVDDPERLFYARVNVTTGKAAGRSLWIGMIAGDALIPYAVGAPELFAGVEVGDEVAYDNREFVAYCFYHRYHPAFPENHQFTVDGVPVYPQRGEWKDEYTGAFTGKMIFCQGALDSNVFPTNTYPRLVQEHFGDAAGDHFRLWWMDNCTHTVPTLHRQGAVWDTRLVDYAGIIDQALRDVVRWVEEGVAPPTMSYRYTADNGLVLPDSAEERGGIQPVAHARANGGVRAEVAVGDTVTFEGEATVPAGAGTIVGAEWDFDGTATWPVSHDVDPSVASINVTATHTFATPGTYFPCFRVASHRDGAEGRGAPVRNLARVRVVVS